MTGRGGDDMATNKGQVSKTRARVTLGAGVFLVVVMGAVWLWIVSLTAANPVTDPAYAQFLGRIYVAFAIIIVCGFLGILNGVSQLRTGRQNVPLSLVILLLFLIALGTMWFGLSGMHQ